MIAASATLAGVPSLDRALTLPPPFSRGPSLYEVFSIVASVGATAGALMLGLASLRVVRGFGRWRSLPLVPGIFGAPLSYPSYTGEVLGGAIGGLGAVVVLGSLWLLVNLGWVLLGHLLVRARGRERALVEAENLALARRL